VFLARHRPRLVDCIVSVGSQPFHDLHWARGQGYYRHDSVDGDFGDENLRDDACNRYHNVISSDILERKTGHWARDVWRKNAIEHYPYSSRELFSMLSADILQIGHYRYGNSFVVDSYANGVPVIVPTLHDSWLGCEMVNMRRGIQDDIVNGEIVINTVKPFHIVYDALKDVEEVGKITALSLSSGLIVLGGGVPRNFMQQTTFLYNLTSTLDDEKNFDHAIRFSADKVSLGGLSGSTFQEGVAWGKISKKARNAHADGDLTLLFPLAVAGLLKKLKESKICTRQVPYFHWKDDPKHPLEITYE
jgi:deoxyhypusine synthase